VAGIVEKRGAVRRWDEPDQVSEFFTHGQTVFAFRRWPDRLRRSYRRYQREPKTRYAVARALDAARLAAGLPYHSTFSSSRLHVPAARIGHFRNSPPSPRCCCLTILPAVPPFPRANLLLYTDISLLLIVRFDLITPRGTGCGRSAHITNRETPNVPLTLRH
jgi:hypothetical protein